MMVVMRRLVHLFALGAISAVALLAAGCGGSETALPQLESLSAVTSASKAADSVAFEMELEQQALGMDLTITADGAFDNAANRGRMRMDLSALAELMSGFGKAFGAGEGEIPDELADPEAWKIDVVVDGTKVYLRAPMLGSQLGGKEWVGGDAAELARSQGTDLGQIGSIASSDPREALDALEAVSGGLEAVGREEVRGVETTHYRTTIDPAKIPGEAAAAGASGDLLAGLTGALKQVQLAEIPVDVWVDDDGLLRKYTLSLDLEQSGQKIAMALRLELFDYGAAVELDLPDPADVADIATLQGLR